MRNSGGSPTSKQPRRRHSRSMRGKRGDSLPSSRCPAASLPRLAPLPAAAASGFCLRSRKGNAARASRAALLIIVELPGSTIVVRLLAGKRAGHIRTGVERGNAGLPPSSPPSPAPAMSRGRLSSIAVLTRNVSRAARTSSLVSSSASVVDVNVVVVVAPSRSRRNSTLA